MSLRSLLLTALLFFLGFAGLLFSISHLPEIDRVQPEPIVPIDSLVSGDSSLGENADGSEYISEVGPDPEVLAEEANAREIKAQEEVRRNTLPDADDAQVIVHVYDDFFCEFCSRNFFETIVPLKNSNLLAEGGVAFEFVTLPLTEESYTVERFAECAERQSQDAMWLFRRAFFLLPEKSAEKSWDIINTIAETVELSTDDIDACLQESDWGEPYAVLAEEARDFGVRGAPTIRIGERLFEGTPPIENLEREIRSQLQKN